MSQNYPGVVAEGVIDGLTFTRLYFTDAGHETSLQVAKEENDYVFVYSLVDLGDVEGFSHETKATQLVALDGTEDEVFAGLNKNNRYKVRRSYRDEEITVVADDDRRAESLVFYQDIKTADGVTPDIDEDFATVRWINAYRGDELISSTCWFDSGEVLRAKHIVSTRKEEGSDPNLIGRLTRRLFWEACVLGISGGRRFVDLGGVDTDDPAKAGVAEFKQSFGGDLVDVHVYRHETEAWADVSSRVLERGRVVV